MNPSSFPRDGVRKLLLKVLSWLRRTVPGSSSLTSTTNQQSDSTSNVPVTTPIPQTADQSRVRTLLDQIGMRSYRGQSLSRVTSLPISWHHGLCKMTMLPAAFESGYDVVTT